MQKYFSLSLILVTILISSGVPAHAEEKAKEAAPAPTPIMEWITAENELLDTLGQPNKESFFIFRNKHSVIRSVNIVRRDIKNAVKSCGQENKELKEPMNTRFKEWENAVMPILKEAEKFLALELKEQDSFYATDYKHVMKLNDKAYEFSESKIEKTPSTSKESCDALLESMNKTEDKLVDILQEMLLPEEVVRERAEQNKKLEEKNKSK